MVKPIPKTVFPAKLKEPQSTEVLVDPQRRATANWKAWFDFVDTTVRRYSHWFTFLELEDTPDSYAGEGGKVVAVKGDESGLEFVDPSGSGAGNGFGFNYTNRFKDGEFIGAAHFSKDITFPSAAGIVKISVESPATSNRSMIIKKWAAGVETQVGTIDFVAGASTGTVTWAPTSPFTLPFGQKLKLYAPVTSDATLANVTAEVPGDM